MALAAQDKARPVSGSSSEVDADQTQWHPSLSSIESRWRSTCGSRWTRSTGWVKAGRLPCVRVGSQVRFTSDDVDAFIATHRQPGPSAR